MGSSRPPERLDVPVVRLNRASPYLRLQSATVYVRNQDESLRFYVDQLGFDIAYDADSQVGRWVAVAPPDGEAVLAIVAPKPDSAEYDLVGRARNIAFITEDVAAKFGEWSARGVHFLHPPQLASWGGIYSVFTDRTEMVLR